MSENMERTAEMKQGFAQEIYKACEKRISPTEINTTYMCAGMLMKIAIEMYTVGMKDEAIVSLLEVIGESVPNIRKRVEGAMSEITFH